ncbi:hypothetical protein SORBI_3006G263250 [Sorghum bicolor]|uniref:Uncharacterized protein n=1 Tax=Sorghum bicolor TaxID=4558 RepID=A0A1Z5RGR4_SORBI|nr:hypothetical protein SORBI_3006G263250 [Sorghum bicolor]
MLLVLMQVIKETCCQNKNMQQPPKEVPETAVPGVRFWMPRARMGSLARQCIRGPHTNRPSTCLYTDCNRHEHNINI